MAKTPADVTLYFLQKNLKKKGKKSGKIVIEQQFHTIYIQTQVIKNLLKVTALGRKLNIELRSINRP